MRMFAQQQKLQTSQHDQFIAIYRSCILGRCLTTQEEPDGGGSCSLQAQRVSSVSPTRRFKMVSSRSVSVSFSKLQRYVRTWLAPGNLSTD